MKSAFRFRDSSITTRLGAGAVITLLAAALLVHILSPRKLAWQDESMLPGTASVRNFETLYDDWKAVYSRNGGDRYLELALGWSRGLSAEFSRASGQAKFDLIDKSVVIEVYGLPEESLAEVWLVDNHPGPQRSVMPEAGDTIVRIGRMKTEAGVGRLQAELDRETFAGFNLDLVVVSKADQEPGQGGMLFGTPTLFQRIYRNAQRTRQGVAIYPSPSADMVRAGLGFSLFENSSGDTEETRTLAVAQLVQEGAEIFFNQTFEGNGRTCGTCHRLENNFTIDPEFIATLPPNDPLFVAEFTEALNSDQNGGMVFENPKLMREAGLIVENLDGFDDLKSKFVMRAVPHLLSLRFSLNPSFGDGTTEPPQQRTGWSGDGAPGSGTLREFATGAVMQHFTKTLNRQPGVDFRLPTDHELDALEAYQLSISRGPDPILLLTLFRNLDVITGQALFLTKGKCNICHFNAGANLILTNTNRNFNTGVEDFPSPFADLGQPLPRDGGFGQAANGDGHGGFGNGTFNTPSIIEAGDTEPNFHNNISAKLDSAVDFYNSDEFNNSPGGQLVGGVDLNDKEVFQVTAFLYVLNVLENVRLVNDLLLKAIPASNPSELFRIALEETNDAIASMADAEVQGEVVGTLNEARGRIESARSARFRFMRIIEIGRALAKLQQARSSLVIFGQPKPTADAGEEAAPSTYALFQNYPNPFNPSTEIRFQLPEAGAVAIRIFNALGQEIRRLEEGYFQPGVHSVRWDGKDEAGHDAASGVYLYQLQAGSFMQVKKMNLVR